VLALAPMKRTHGLALCTLLSLAACMNTPGPQEPENSDEEPSGDKKKNPDAISPDDSSGSSMLGSGGTPSAPMKEHATIKDDTEKKGKVSCGGANIPDLLAIVGQTACEVPKATPDNEPTRDAKDLEIKVSIDAPKVPPGTKASVTVTFHNKGKTEMPLDFVADPEPRFDLELYTLKGKRADNPPGAEPALPGGGEAPEKAISRVTLAPQGTAKLVLPWEANKYKWVPAEKAKGALPGQHYPREVAGPLPKGKYSLKVVMPLVGIAEGSDHEISQPRLAVEVGGP
jgi:hypothetical protein